MIAQPVADGSHLPAGSPPLPALEAIDASKRYRRGGSWALRDVTLAVAPGTITALVGPNGAGKSTLIRSWIGFEPLTGGTVRVMGTDPAADRAAAVGSVGYVSQSTALYRGLTVGDHLALAGTLRHGFDAAAAELRLDQLEIRCPRRRARCPADRPPRWRCASPLVPAHRCCCWMSPSRPWTRWRGTTS